MRLGLHEYAFDVYFKSDVLPEDDVRDHVLVSMYNKIDLSIDPPTIFKDEQILNSLRYKVSWNRYGVCSYDCGPLAIGREGFVPLGFYVYDDFKSNKEALRTSSHKHPHGIKVMLESGVVGNNIKRAYLPCCEI
ncbi:hypothetical protein CACET_c26450 [Clostridium aceticum]|uniref:Uncharacterized protein n=1 Tax=Clostridium aceticum TaxID=84022 RepID=A0A0D8I8H8_9CLOT|nr:DUF2196 domain-containing protein [Clostridium aceticum]AKL96090.1 hypothetical protein CACET_c26450 [Clostridium aceticum]KJF25541.1 hypothetical protein TZ02_18230 [Clostridium aceticum]